MGRSAPQDPAAARHHARRQHRRDCARWGDQLQFVAEAGPGDFIYVPPFVPHQEINASTDETLECVLVRSDNEAIAINLEIEPVEKPETVLWVDPVHRHPGEKK